MVEQRTHLVARRPLTLTDVAQGRCGWIRAEDAPSDEQPFASLDFPAGYHNAMQMLVLITDARGLLRRILSGEAALDTLRRPELSEPILAALTGDQDRLIDVRVKFEDDGTSHVVGWTLVDDDREDGMPCSVVQRSATND